MRSLQEINSYPIFTEDWGADEELLLVTGIASQGVGNWRKIAEHVGTRTKEEVEKHYNEVYVDSPDWPLPAMDREFDIDPEEFQERKRRRISTMNAMAPPPPKVAPTSAPGIHEIATFLPGRLEFEHELDNDAEDIVKDLEFGVCLEYGGDELPEDEEDADVKSRLKWKEEQRHYEAEKGAVRGKTLPVGKGPLKGKGPMPVNGKANGHHGNGNVIKQEKPGDNGMANGADSQNDEEAEEPTQPPPFETPDSLKFKLTLMEMYTQRIEKRLEGKGFIFNRGLLEYKKMQAAEKKRPREERDIIHRLRPFAKIQTAEDYEEFASDMLYEAILRKKILDLQTYRRLGLTSATDIEKYEQDLAKRASALRKPFSSRVTYSSLTGAGKSKSTSRLSCWGSGGWATFLRLPGSAPGAPVVRRPPAPLNLANSPSLHLLTPAEQTLCSQLRILPKPYLVIKETLVREYARRGGKLRRREARDLVKIDVNKTSRIWEFLVQAGFLKITQEPTAPSVADVRYELASAAPSATPSVNGSPLKESRIASLPPPMGASTSTGSLSGSLFSTSMASTPNITLPWPPH
ncbi:hypothetical protein DXG03_004059 [Asterophora parasitica]|uniref:Transcriptional adapter 2 n=1 Tax=Asterophora parasitica TaxID=117018 RepID=A0A9P7G8Y6_9AGAR|nr:hypothetical protein DXG03_004059 [Asterophora parasitica]